MPDSSKWSFPLRFPHQNPAYTSPPYVLHVRPSHCFLSDHSNTIGEQYRPLSSSLRTFLHPKKPMYCDDNCTDLRILNVFYVQGSLHRDKFLQQNQLDALISQIYFWNKILHVSDSSSVHHQEFFTVNTAIVYVIQVWCVYTEKLRMMDRGTV